MTPSRRYQSALKHGVALWLLPKESQSTGFWSKCASIISMYLDSKAEFQRAIRNGTMPEMIAEARRLAAGPV